MKYNIERINVLSDKSGFCMLQGWIVSEKCSREDIKILSGECYKIARVNRADVALAHDRKEEDYQCGFEIIIEYPHNGTGYKMQISDGTEQEEINVDFASLCAESTFKPERKKELYTDRLSEIEFYESDGINYNIELITWNQEISEFIIRGWAFAKTTGKSDVSISQEGRCIKCSRRDVHDYFSEKSISVNETCGFEICINDQTEGIDIIFEDENGKILLHLGKDYLRKISKFSKGSAWANNKVFTAFKDHFEKKKILERYGEEGLKYKKAEREINLEEEGLNRSTYSYEKKEIPLSWIKMQRKQPKIDILVALKDVDTRMEYIKKLIACFENQKYQNFRVLFIGKGEEINPISSLTKLESSFIQCDKDNKTEMYNAAFTSIDADYFMFVNQEDYFEDEFLASYIEQVNLNPDKSVICSNFDIDLNGELIFPIMRKERYLQENQEFRLIATLFSKKEFDSMDSIMKLCNKDNIVENACIYYHYRMVKDAFNDSLHSKAIAFYLPQFHENEENNKWWGEGFTEWTNVRRAVPMFENHNQPRIPADLGYYDLVEDKTVEYKQVELAKKYGVHGFCFYYYWFEGKRLLRKPFDQFIEDKNLDFPYCICWANETWSRRWNGDEKEVLMKQVHNAKTDKQFIYSVMSLFKDERYIKIDGKPLLLIYRIELFPKPAQTIQTWRELCIKEGIGDIHVALVQSFGMVDHRIYGADSSVEFPPHKIQASEINATVLKNGEEHEGKIYSYEEVVKNQMIVQQRDYTLYPGSMLGWDNTARRMKAANVFHGYTPELFEQWLVKNYMYTRMYNTEPVMFINAWNEWAEGTYLEPDQKYGTRALEIVKEVVNFK